jgi:Tfp pilus assembly protein PilV
MIEVVISASLLILGITAAANLQSAMSRNSAEQRRFITANEVGEQTIERLLIVFGGSATLSAGHHDGPAYNLDGVPAADGIFSTSWDVIENTPIQNVRQVVVEVRWRDFGRDRSIKLSTFRS